jgi:hypothetical protein
VRDLWSETERSEEEAVTEGFTAQERSMLDQLQASMRDVRCQLEAWMFRELYGFDANPFPYIHLIGQRPLRRVLFPRCKVCRDLGYVEREVTLSHSDPRWSAMLFGGFGGTQYVIERDPCPACGRSVTYGLRS